MREEASLTQRELGEDSRTTPILGPQLRNVQPSRGYLRVRRLVERVWRQTILGICPLSQNEYITADMCFLLEAYWPLTQRELAKRVRTTAS